MWDLGPANLLRPRLFSWKTSGQFLSCTSKGGTQGYVAFLAFKLWGAALQEPLAVFRIGQGTDVSFVS